MKISSLMLCTLTASCFLFSEETDISKDMQLLELLKDKKQLEALTSSLENKINTVKSDIPLNEETLVPLNKGFFYLKSGATSGVLETEPNLLLGFGYRSKLIKSKINYINVVFDVNIQISDKKHQRYSAGEIYLPKFNALYYLSPDKDKSFYLGSGVSLIISDPAYIIAKKDSDQFSIKKDMILYSDDAFIGTGVTFIAGYESSLHTKYMNSIQIEMNLPTELSENEYVYSEKDLAYLDHWTLNLSYCIGY